MDGQLKGRHLEEEVGEKESHMEHRVIRKLGLERRSVEK
jgi:hypothetical protein